MIQNFYQLQKQRRSIYALGKNITLTPQAIVDLIQNSIKESPSAFNSQSTRAVVLLGQEHTKLWDLTLETLRKIVPTEAFPATEQKVNGSFKAGFGTVLFFEDQEVVQDLQTKFAPYANNFPIWSEQASGIATYAVWLALTEQNIGASLQHYNPIIDEKVAQTWNIPAHWKLRAQLVFGSIEALATTKEYIDDDERFKVFGI